MPTCIVVLVVLLGLLPMIFIISGLLYLVLAIYIRIVYITAIVLRYTPVTPLLTLIPHRFCSSISVPLLASLRHTSFLSNRAVKAINVSLALTKSSTLPCFLAKWLGSSSPIRPWRDYSVICSQGGQPTWSFHLGHRPSFFLCWNAQDTLSSSLPLFALLLRSMLLASYAFCSP